MTIWRGPLKHTSSPARLRFLVHRCEVDRVSECGVSGERAFGASRRIGHDDRMKLAGLPTSLKNQDDPEPGWTHGGLSIKLAD